MSQESKPAVFPFRKVGKEQEIFVKDDEVNTTTIIVVDEAGIQTRFNLNELINTFDLRN